MRSPTNTAPAAPSEELKQQIIDTIRERRAATREFLQLFCDRGTPVEVEQAVRELQRDDVIRGHRHPLHGRYIVLMLREEAVA